MMPISVVHHARKIDIRCQIRWQWPFDLVQRTWKRIGSRRAVVGDDNREVWFLAKNLLQSDIDRKFWSSAVFGVRAHWVCHGSGISGFHFVFIFGLIFRTGGFTFIRVFYELGSRNCLLSHLIVDNKVGIFAHVLRVPNSSKVWGFTFRFLIHAQFVAVCICKKNSNVPGERSW